MRSDSDKIKFIDDHYCYEVKMMYQSYFLKIREDNPNKDYFTNVKLELFIFHARNLMEFYYVERLNKKGERRYKDDAWASDFFSKNNWSEIRPCIDLWKDKFFKRAGKEMAHLSYSRLDLSLKEKEWNIYEIAKPLRDITIQFIDNIDKEYKTERILELHNFLKSIFSSDVLTSWCFSTVSIT